MSNGRKILPFDNLIIHKNNPAPISANQRRTRAGHNATTTQKGPT